MYELSAIENYVHMDPKTPEEEQSKLWAKETGFLVTILKPYYWEAHTPKEKEFFIGSMVKVYTKFTDRFDRKCGKYPILTGFAQEELNALTDGRPYAATKEGRAAHDEWMAPYTNRDDVKPPSDDPGPYARFETTRPPRASPGPLPPRSQGFPPPGDRRRMPPPDDRRPRGPPRPPGAEGLPRERMAPRPGPPPLADRGDPAIFRGSPGENRMPPGSPRFGPPNSRTPPPPGFQNGYGQRPPMDQNLRTRPSRENMALRPSPSRERLQPLPGQPPPMPIPPPQRLSPQSSRSDLRAKTPDTTASGASIPPSLSPGRPTFPDDTRSQRSQRSLDGSSLEGTGSGASIVDERRANQPSGFRRDLSPRGLRPNTAQSNASSALSRNEDSGPEDFRQRTAPPERRRPPMENRSFQQTQPSMESLTGSFNVETPPPMEPPPRRRPQEIPERLKPGSPPVPATVPTPTLQDRMRYADPSDSSIPLSQPPPPPTSPLPEIPKVFDQKDRSSVAEKIPADTQVHGLEKEAIPEIIQESSKEPVSEAGTGAEDASEVKPTSPASENDEGAAARSGLGSVAGKKKMGKAEAANTFRKAAAAVGAFKAAGQFKPRAGGGADKLFAKETKTSDEPDGISAVFVPQRLTPKEDVEKKSEDDVKPKADGTTKDRLSIHTEVVPEVKVSAPLSPTPVASTTSDVTPSPALDSEKPVAKTQSDVEVRRKKRRSIQQMKNISRLGIDPNILDERGLDFEILLSEFGWGSGELSAKNIESLESDIKREIARVEAGSWLSHLEQKDDRVETVEKLLDRAIAECDELEGLLTLYNVELSVSCECACWRIRINYLCTES